MFLDLKMVEIRSLPANLSSEKRYNLTGIFYLQIMKIVDISKPKLWQLQRIRNKVAKNTELEKDFGKRVRKHNIRFNNLEGLCLVIVDIYTVQVPNFNFCFIGTYVFFLGIATDSY